MRLKYRPVPFIAGIALFLFLLTAPFVAYSETLEKQEYEVKAAFLFNFAKLTEWPGDAFRLPDKNFELCILGDDPFKSSIEPFSHQTISGRNISITRMTDISESSGCNLIYIASSERDSLPEIIKHVGNKAILTVSDINGFENKGGIIALLMKNNRIRFRINITAARKSKLKISSHLLEVAESVSEIGR